MAPIRAARESRDINGPIIHAQTLVRYLQADFLKRMPGAERIRSLLPLSEFPSLQMRFGATHRTD